MSMGERGASQELNQNMPGGSLLSGEDLGLDDVTVSSNSTLLGVVVDEGGAEAGEADVKSCFLTLSSPSASPWSGVGSDSPRRRAARPMVRLGLSC